MDHTTHLESLPIPYLWASTGTGRTKKMFNSLINFPSPPEP